MRVAARKGARAAAPEERVQIEALAQANHLRRWLASHAGQCLDEQVAAQAGHVLVWAEAAIRGLRGWHRGRSGRGGGRRSHRVQTWPSNKSLIKCN